MRALALLRLTVCAAMLLLAASVNGRFLPPKWHQLSESYSFEQYVRDLNKGYARDSTEWRRRERIFSHRIKGILHHNAKPDATYKQGVNRFTDWTDSELSRIRGARHEPKFAPRNGGRHVVDYALTGKPVASNLDYREAWPRVLTSVKDQGFCGDCWAHATTEAIESSYAISSGQLLVLSQQQITSCTPAEGSCYACDGMYPRYALEYAATTPYIMEEWVYPFKSYRGTNVACTNQTNPPYPVVNTVSLAGYTQIAPNRQDHVVEALNALGPLMILVDASSWSSYESGVFTGCSYNASFGLDHAVLLVGYGFDEKVGQDYWIVRNSWSAGWGEGGYIRLLKTAEASCGVNTFGMSCFADTPQPVPSCGMCGLLTDPQFPIVSY